MGPCSTWLSIIGVLLIAMVQPGCNTAEEESFASATGLVLVDGEKLSGAVVTLEPIGTTRGPNASVPVLAGRFHVPYGDELQGGTYRVRFSMIPINLRSMIPDDGNYLLPPVDTVIAPDFDMNSQIIWELSLDELNEREFQIEIIDN